MFIWPQYGVKSETQLTFEEKPYTLPKTDSNFESGKNLNRGYNGWIKEDKAPF